MRKILISLLLASAAASPAIAGPRNWSDNQQAHADRQQARDDRQQVREERVQVRDDARAERPSFTAPARMQAQPDRQQFVERQQFARPERVQPQVDMNAMRAQRDAYAAQQRDAYAAQQRDAYAAQRNQRVEQMQQRFYERQQDARDFRQSTRPAPNVMRDRHPLVVSDTPRPGTQPPLRAESHVQWNTDWRNNSRYDWQNYRRHHRSLFHLGFYYDPFGWGYQSYDIGYRMWPAYYGNQFWIDPGMYGLPFPPPGAVWIRYFNDAMLIDTYTGTVIDVIPGFFW